MLREARIVMPRHDTPQSIDTHVAMTKALIEAFGGVTAYDGMGAWRDNDGETFSDDVVIYDIAIKAERDSSWNILAGIALKAGRKLNQQSVYIRYPDGSVEIMSTTPKTEAAPPARPGLKDRVVQPDKPLGTKRVPMPGELWTTNCGAMVLLTQRPGGLAYDMLGVVVANGGYSGCKPGEEVGYRDDGAFGMARRDKARDPYPMDLKVILLDS